MKKYVNLAFFYAILGLFSGVFFREFTKYNDFTGQTTLSTTHTHLFALGMVMFLIVGLYVQFSNVTVQKPFKGFIYFYNAGLILTVILMYVRGIFEVLGTTLSKGASASISGMAGIGHILIAIGMVCLFLALRKAQAKQ